uniref:HTH_48 domain-containing protein n=1 Tax=Strongyloides venezuelensis TaxID=75913 RepID=A0A0K0FT78_STRVS
MLTISPSHNYIKSKPDAYRRYHKAYETEMNIVIECPANINPIKERHDNICKILHREIVKKMKADNEVKNLYERSLAEIIKDEKSIIYDLPLSTGEIVFIYNRPDMLHGLTATEIFDDMQNILGENSLSFATIKRWVSEFKHGKTSLEDDLRSGRPKTATTKEIIEKVHEMIMDVL